MASNITDCIGYQKIIDLLCMIFAILSDDWLNAYLLNLLLPLWHVYYETKINLSNTAEGKLK